MVEKNSPIWRAPADAPEGIPLWVKFGGIEAYSKYVRNGDDWFNTAGDEVEKPTHWRYPLVVKFEYNRPSPEEFSVMLAKSGLPLNDFLYLSGRRRDQIEQFIGGDTRAFTPTMGDVMILKLAELDEANVDDMNEIADAFIIGPSERRPA